jgi:hypothetical protein
MQRKLPGSQTRGIAALALFTTVQIVDAIWTAHGIARFGVGIEANPILYALVSFCGVTGALVVAKSVAIFSGAFLHFTSRDLVLSLLTVVYVFGAILPWAWALAT